MDYFTQSEKTCQCGCGLNLIDKADNMDFLRALNTARALYGKEMNAISMTRCPAHNQEIRGAKHSAHMDGRAADINCHGTEERAKMVHALEQTGFRRFELKRTNIHCDMKKGAPDMLTYLTDEGMI